MTNDNCTNAENKSVIQIDDTKNIPSQNVLTEDERPINGNPQEKSLELEIREIYADRQALDRQISEKKKLLEDVNKQLKRVNKEYKKLRKSKGRTYFYAYVC